MVRIATSLGSKSVKVLARRNLALLAAALSYVERLHGQDCKTTNDNKLIYFHLAGYFISSAFVARTTFEDQTRL